MVNRRTYKRQSVLKENIEPIEGILNLCRLCLEEAKDSVPIFADENDICSSLATKIMMCVGYEVTHEDCLPNAICPECHNEVNNFYKFKKKCYNTYYTLKNHLSAVKREPQEMKCEENVIKSNVSDYPNSQSVNKISESVNTVSQPAYQVSGLVHPIIQSVCTVNESGCPVSQSVNPVSQSVFPISQSVSPVSQSIYTVAQSASAVSHSVSSVNQSVCPVSQFFSSVSQSVYPVSQSIFTVSESVNPVNESIYTASQSEYPVTESVFTIKQLDCPVSQTICTEIHPNSISQSNYKNLSDNTEYQLVFPLYQSASQQVTSLVSESVAETRDQLTLAFEDVTQLEFVHTELKQNGLHNLVDVNGKAEALETAAPNKGVEEAKSQEVETAAQSDVCPNFAGYLSAVLLEMGVLSSPSSDGDVQTEHCSTIVIETKDGEQVQLELIQVEDSVLEKTDEQKTSKNETRKASKKSTKKSRKRGTDDRPVCAACGRRFASRGVLARHLRVHTGERPFRCARCGAAFSQREVLRRHEFVHQEVRPFACARCPKSFTQRSSLAAHARRHEPACARSLHMHRCTKCPKMFLHASGLSRHMMTHSGRTFQCAHCGRHFSDVSSVRRHTRCMHQTTA